MRKYFDTALLANGLPAGGAKVTVLIQSSQMNAVIYSDQGITPIPNPVTCDSTGFFSFFAADGTYQLNFSDANGVLLKTVTQVEIVELQPLGTGSGGTGVTTAKDSILYRNVAGQSIPNAVATTVTGWTLVSSIFSNFNAATGIYTVPSAGQYVVSAATNYTAAAGVAGTSCQTIINVDGSAVVQGNTSVYGTSNIATQSLVSAVISLAANQQVSVQAFQNSGIARTLGNTNAATTYLSITRVI